jgi:hypothetical protein
MPAGADPASPSFCKSEASKARRLGDRSMELEVGAGRHGVSDGFGREPGRGGGGGVAVLRQYPIQVVLAHLVHREDQFRRAHDLRAPGRILGEGLAQLGDGRRFEDAAQRQFGLQRFAQARHELGCQERMPAQFGEEIVVNADLFEAEDLGP